MYADGSSKAQGVCWASQILDPYPASCTALRPSQFRLSQGAPVYTLHRLSKFIRHEIRMCTLRVIQHSFVPRVSSVLDPCYLLSVA